MVQTANRGQAFEAKKLRRKRSPRSSARSTSTGESYCW